MKKHGVISTSNDILTAYVKTYKTCINTSIKYALLLQVKVSFFLTKKLGVISTPNEIIDAKVKTS